MRFHPILHVRFAGVPQLLPWDLIECRAIRVMGLRNLSHRSEHRLHVYCWVAIELFFPVRICVNCFREDNPQGPVYLSPYATLDENIECNSVAERPHDSEEDGAGVCRTPSDFALETSLVQELRRGVFSLPVRCDVEDLGLWSAANSNAVLNK